MIMRNKQSGWMVLYYATSVFLGYFFFFLFSTYAADFNPLDFGLGRNTSSKVGVFKGDTVSAYPVSKDFNSIHSVQRTFEKYRSENRKIALLMGASQLHSINNMKPDDKLLVEKINEFSSGSDLRYLQVSSPNANFFDLFIMYKFFRDKKLHPDYLLIAFVYDDLRESPIQPQLLGLVGKFDSTEIETSSFAAQEVEKELKKSELSKHKDAIQRNVTMNTPQEKLEFLLVEFLSKYLPGYQFRNNLIARLEVFYWVTIDGLLSQTFGASNSNTDSKIRYPDIPADIEEWNSKALESMVKLAVNDGCKIIIYRQPIRPKEGIFYHDREQYDSYFLKLKEKYLNEPSIQFADFENIVPQQYWGTTNLGEPDVFHFTQEGHLRLAVQIDSLMRSQTATNAF